MKKGGTNSTDLINHVIRIAGVAAPIALILYGALVMTGFLPSLNYLDDTLFLALSFGWLLIAIYFFLFPPKTAAIFGVAIGSYFVIGALFTLFVTGFNTPLIVTWVLLIVATYLKFGRKGVFAGIAAFASIVAVDALILHGNEPIIQINNLMIMVTLLICTLALILIQKSQQVDQEVLDHAVEQESIERERLLTLINNVADGILSIDTEGVIRVYNAASLNLLDTNGSLNGHNIDEVVQLTTQDGTPYKLYEEVKSIRTVTVRDDLQYKMSEDETMRIEATLSPIRSTYSRSRNGVIFDGYIIILRDITKAKSLEEERDEFISVVSHELRTPITIAEGSISNAQYMLEKDAEKSRLTDALDVAHTQTVFLAKMINDLSTLSRAERGVGDESEDIDVKEFANGLFNEYAPQAEEKGLALNLDIGARLGAVSASRLYLHELMQNFITNAIKYTHEGTITVMVHAKKGSIEFAVKDTGIGISKTDKERVFDKFYRAEDYRTRETSGTGLGLYVSAKLARKLGCKINVQSRLNHGSTFSFTLPQLKKQPTK